MNLGFHFYFWNIPGEIQNQIEVKNRHGCCNSSTNIVMYINFGNKKIFSHRYYFEHLQIFVNRYFLNY